MEKLPQVGSRFKNKHGHWFTVIESNRSTDILIKFDHKDYIKRTQTCYIRSGIVKLPSIFVGDIVLDKLGNKVTISNIDTSERITFKWEDGYERTCKQAVLSLNTLMREEDSQRLSPSVKVGDSFRNFRGNLFIVKEYINSSKVLVEFQEPIKHCVYSSSGNILKGNLKNKYAPTVCNVGIIGDCSVSTKSKVYTSWVGVLKRVYGENPRHAYRECTVDPAWFQLETFNTWFLKQRVQDAWELDKDLLVKGNKVYSEENCLFLPQAVNTFLTDRANHRGKWPVGVTYHARLNKWEAACTFDSKRNYLGVFTDPTQAFLVYKEYKEGCAKVLAKRWEGIIDDRAITALLNFKVDIKD